MKLTFFSLLRDLNIFKNLKSTSTSFFSYLFYFTKRTSPNKSFKIFNFFSLTTGFLFAHLTPFSQNVLNECSPKSEKPFNALYFDSTQSKFLPYKVIDSNPNSINLENKKIKIDHIELSNSKLITSEKKNTRKSISLDLNSISTTKTNFKNKSDFLFQKNNILNELLTKNQKKNEFLTKKLSILKNDQFDLQKDLNNAFFELNQFKLKKNKLLISKKKTLETNNYLKNKCFNLTNELKNIKLKNQNLINENTDSILKRAELKFTKKPLKSDNTFLKTFDSTLNLQNQSNSIDSNLIIDNSFTLFTPNSGLITIHKNQNLYFISSFKNIGNKINKFAKNSDKLHLCLLPNFKFFESQLLQHGKNIQNKNLFILKNCCDAINFIFPQSINDDDLPLKNDFFNLTSNEISDFNSYLEVLTNQINFINFLVEESVVLFDCEDVDYEDKNLLELNRHVLNNNLQKITSTISTFEFKNYKFENIIESSLLPQNQRNELKKKIDSLI